MGDPFAVFWPQVQRLSVAQARGDPRITAALRRTASGQFPPTTDPGARETRAWVQAEAHDRLARTSHPAEYAVTTDVWAAVALQVQWAVDANLVLLACPHPGCGRAFFRDQRGARYCPAHRSPAARQARSRWRTGLRPLDGSPRG